MSGIGRTIRAFRPSRFGLIDEYDEEIQQEKLANMEVYAVRAEAGLPLFERELPARATVAIARKVHSR